MSKYLLFAMMIFPLTFTGCGDDDGGGGKGPKTPSVHKVGVRSYGQVSAGRDHSCALTASGGRPMLGQWFKWKIR